MNWLEVAYDLWGEFYRSGGLVMPPLVLATMVLWYALGYRLMTLQRGDRRPVYVIIEQSANGREVSEEHDGIIDRAVALALAKATSFRGQSLRPHLDEAFFGIQVDLSRFGVLVRSIVVIAPLAGLLGTVGGMIETFDSLADMALFSQSGGIAGGISQALITTQMGLVVAIPGVIVGRILERRQHQLEDELERIKDIVVSERGHILGAKP